MPERDIKRGLLHFLVEKVSVRAYAVCLAIVVLAFGVLYACLTPFEQGFFHDGENQKDALWYNHLFNGIYFSVVTISSLGYGDFRPVGVSKVLTSLEVLIGVAILGIIIAKLTSRRIEFRISRLSRSNIEAYLDARARTLYDLGVSLAVMLEDAGDRYPSSPVSNISKVKGDTSGENEREEMKKFSMILEDIGIQCNKLREYFSEETESGDFFQIAPIQSLLRVANNAESTVFFLMQLLMALPVRSKSKWLSMRNRMRISSIAKDIEYLCRSMENSNTDLRSEAAIINLRHACDNLTSSYYRDPIHPDEMQPDQEPPADGIEPIEEAEFVSGLAAR